MKVNLKSTNLTIDDIEMEKIYVGSSGDLFYFTTMHQDNRIKEDNLRFLCITLNSQYGNYMFNNKEALHKHVCQFGLRKANFEINEI